RARTRRRSPVAPAWWPRGGSRGGVSTCLRACAVGAGTPCLHGAAAAVMVMAALRAGRNGVMTARVERVAAQNAPRREGHALDHAMGLDGLERVLAAGGMEAATWHRLQRREVPAVQPNGRQDDVLRQAAHAVAPARAKAARRDTFSSVYGTSAADGLATTSASNDDFMPSSMTSARMASRRRRLTRLRTTALPTLRLTTMATLTSPVRVSRSRTVRCLLPETRPLTSRWKSLSDFSDRKIGRAHV